MLIEGTAGGKGVVDESIPMASGPPAKEKGQVAADRSQSLTGKSPLLLFRLRGGAAKVGELFFALSRSMGCCGQTPPHVDDAPGLLAEARFAAYHDNAGARD